MNQVEKLIAGGMRPDRIGFLAFTRKAARVARQRAQERFSFSDEEMPWFRTIHSMAFQQTGVSGKNLMKKDDMAEVSARVGYDFHGDGPSEDGQFEMGYGCADQMFFLDNKARATGMSLETVWEQRAETHATDNFGMDDLALFSHELDAYKTTTAKMDYTDALEVFCSKGLPPPVDILFVDEAQDLSSLQWSAIRRAASTVKRVIIAGDDDQAIFRWAGADVEQFIALEGTSTVLGQSHRVPRQVHSLAMQLLARISHRRVKKFAPRIDAEGQVLEVWSHDDFDASQGSWLFLARHGYQLRQLEGLCRDRGWFYESRTGASNATDEARAILSWENLRQGGTARAEDLAYALQLAGQDPGKLAGEDLVTINDVPWVDASRPWTEWRDTDEGEYFRMARRAGERMGIRDKESGLLVPAPPRIKVSTIHGSKGDEAQNVYLMTDVTYSTHRSLQENADDECRVFYVGVTRASETLVVKQPEVSLSFPLLEDM